MLKLQIVSLIAAVLMSLPANAELNIKFGNIQGYTPLQLAQNSVINKAQAIAIAKNRQKGKVLAADLIRSNSSSFYHIKMLTDSGRLKTLRINAESKNNRNNR